MWLSFVDCHKECVWVGLKEDTLWGRVLATALGQMCEEEQQNLINPPSLLPCFCVSLYILPDVVMSVCRRCVGRVAMEMGGKTGIWVECVGQSKYAYR